jgi:hypothetical protein
MNLAEADDVIQDHFEVLDKRIGCRSERQVDIRDLPQDDRDLYLVADIVAITCNAGVGAWIYYHHDEVGWINCAQGAFIRIGHPQVADDLGSSLAVFLAKRGTSVSGDYSKQSRYIFEHEEQIVRSLFNYLCAKNFVFKKHDDNQALIRRPLDCQEG